MPVPAVHTVIAIALGQDSTTSTGGYTLITMCHRIVCIIPTIALSAVHKLTVVDVRVIAVVVATSARICYVLGVLLWRKCTAANASLIHVVSGIDHSVHLKRHFCGGHSARSGKRCCCQCLSLGVVEFLLSAGCLTFHTINSVDVIDALVAHVVGAAAVIVIVVGATNKLAVDFITWLRIGITRQSRWCGCQNVAC